ncbi:MAG: hypothetical protein L0H64_16785, partial [Pseudonocardia sp.]|nr:hypothetical protein [Pseudonocardia sp.]
MSSLLRASMLDVERRPMTSLRTVLHLSLPIIIVLVGAGCSSADSSSGDLDTRTGCSAVTTSPTMAGSQVVMGVRARDCRGPDGRPLSTDEAVDRLAQAVWHSLRLPVDAIHIRVTRSAGTHDNPATVLTSAELEVRFGPGPPGVVWPPREHGTGDTIWFLLPIAYLI